MADKENQEQPDRKTSKTEKTTALLLSYLISTGFSKTVSPTPEFIGEKQPKNVIPEPTPHTTLLPPDKKYHQYTDDKYLQRILDEAEKERAQRTKNGRYKS